MISVQTKVAERITGLAPAVEDKVVTTMVDRELVRRSDALVQVIDKLTKMEEAHKKLVADVTTYDEKGTKLTETFSKKRLDEKASSQKKIDKLTGAVTKALEKGEFNDVYNFAKSDPKSDDAPAEGAVEG